MIPGLILVLHLYALIFSTIITANIEFIVDNDELIEFIINSGELSIGVLPKPFNFSLFIELKLTSILCM